MIDATGTALVPTKPYFPIDIYSAMQRALTASTLPAKLRGTVAALATYADRKQPAKPIRVQQATLAATLGRDVRTIARHLADLETRGWIAKAPQQRVGRITHRGRPFVSGRFAGCLLTLTDAAIAALGLDRAAGKMSDGHTGSELTPTDRQPAPRAERGLPADVAPLSGRLQQPGIFALMKKCTQHGKRLGDIVAVALARIDQLGLTGARLFAYLTKLATGARCFAVDAARLRDAHTDAQQGRVVAQQVAAFRAAQAGRTLVSRDGRTTVQLDGSGTSAQLRKPSGTSTLPLYTDDQVRVLVDAIAAGQLLPAGEGAC